MLAQQTFDSRHPKHDHTHDEGEDEPAHGNLQNGRQFPLLREDERDRAERRDDRDAKYEHFDEGIAGSLVAERQPIYEGANEGVLASAIREGPTDEGNGGEGHLRRFQGPEQRPAQDHAIQDIGEDDPQFPKQG